VSHLAPALMRGAPFGGKGALRGRPPGAATAGAPPPAPAEAYAPGAPQPSRAVMPSQAAQPQPPHPSTALPQAASAALYPLPAQRSPRPNFSLQPLRLRPTVQPWYTGGAGATGSKIWGAAGCACGLQRRRGERCASSVSPHKRAPPLRHKSPSGACWPPPPPLPLPLLLPLPLPLPLHPLSPSSSLPLMHQRYTQGAQLSPQCHSLLASESQGQRLSLASGGGFPGVPCEGCRLCSCLCSPICSCRTLHCCSLCHQLAPERQPG